MKKTTIALIVILIIYTVVSFINLGSTKTPKTIKKYEWGEESYLYFNEKTEVEKVRVYIGNNVSNIKIFLMDSRDSDHPYDLINSFDYISVFTWQEIAVKSSQKFQYLRIFSLADNNYIGEIVAYDKNDNIIEVKAIDSKDDDLVDEQDMAPEEISYMNSVYFDEIYHSRTAYEHLNDIEPYESVHPPLGKVIISIPIAIMGTSPFAFRVMGNIAGILMILVAYFIGKELFKKEWYGVISASIMALDGMHFVQTRIGTVDSFLVLFCLSSFLFMIKYINLDKSEKVFKKLKYLLFSAIFIGMGIATKWTALFVGLGLAILFLVHFIYDIVKSKSFTKDDWKVFIGTGLLFVIIPLGIYLMAYIPLFLNKGCQIKSLKDLYNYTLGMYDYHSKLDATHSFSSSWYTWPLMIKPMWYYIRYYSNNIVSTIVCMGNLLIWWGGVVCTVLSIFYMFFRKNREAFFLLAMIATTWLPYFFIGRVMFIYHYFITIPFVMFSIVMVLKIIEEKFKKKIFSIIVLILFLICFIIYYPVFSGKKVSEDYVNKTKLMDTWIY